PRRPLKTSRPLRPGCAREAARPLRPARALRTRGTLGTRRSSVALLRNQLPLLRAVDVEAGQHVRRPVERHAVARVGLGRVGPRPAPAHARRSRQSGCTGGAGWTDETLRTRRSLYPWKSLRPGRTLRALRGDELP